MEGNRWGGNRKEIGLELVRSNDFRVVGCMFVFGYMVFDIDIWVIRVGGLWVEL